MAIGYDNLDLVTDLVENLNNPDYVADPAIATSLHLAQVLERPLLIEGRAGVGKTQIATTMSELLDTELIRLQCYEGLDETKALYEWRYGKQLLYTQILKEQMQEDLEGAKGLKESLDRLKEFEDIFFSEQFLESRPLLKSLTSSEGTCLLYTSPSPRD